MWLWVDATDPLQWGSHTLSATAGALTATATITATQSRYDVGDGTPVIVCRNPGTPRPWDPKAPLKEESPSGCQHRYMRTNELGNIDSRYTVSAEVVWEVIWSATDGEHGYFTMIVSSDDNPHVDNPTIHVGELRAVLVPNPDPPRETKKPR
jgi:hypothetical protein